MDLSDLWAKAHPSDDRGPAMHPLLAHSLDVAATATLLPQAARLGIDLRTLGFLVALHDIGKVSRSFQAQAAAHWPTNLLGPAPTRRARPGVPRTRGDELFTASAGSWEA